MRRRVLGICGVLASGAALFCLALPASATSADLEQLMQLLAARRHGQVSFVEQHFMKLLKRPTESYGELRYDAPDRLEKRTLDPKPETLTLSGDVLTVERAGRSRVLDLKSYPKMLPLIESIRATLAGDLPALERVFSIEFAGDVSRWSLSLTPRDPELARSVSQVRIEGVRDTLLRVEILETDGDRSLMTLRDHPQR
jgi:hypothetical protein